MKGYVYSIRSHQTEEIYIGSTTQILCNRMAGHRRNYKRWKEGKYNYVTSFEILKYDDAYIEIIVEVEVASKQELYKIEGENIRNHDCVNKIIAGRTKKEHYQANKEQIAEYYQANKEQIAEYYQANKEQILKQHAIKYTCICGSICRIGNKSDHEKTKKHQATLNFLV